MNPGAVAAGIALLAANGFFVAAEFALLAARRARIEQLAAEGNRRARHAIAGMRELSLMLAGAQLGITMASFGLGAVAEPALESGLGRLLGGLPVPAAASHAAAFVLALATVVFLHMVVGEMAPKSWAISDTERSVLLLAGPFRVFALVFRPAIRLLNGSANAVVRLAGVEPQDALATAHAPADLLLLIQEAQESGSLAADQQAMLARALELSGLDAEAAMTPRADIVAVPADADADELERVASDSGRSRLPVYDGELDRIRGVLHVKDLLTLAGAERAAATAGALARTAWLTPESRLLDDLLVDMREQRQHVALVVDEFGSVTGLVALEDVIEELIGEFADESDSAPAPLPRRADGALLLPGTLRPDELADRTGVGLHEGPWETVAGYIIAAVDRIPRVGDTVAAGGTRLEVTKMDGHRVVEVALHRHRSGTQ